MDKYVIKLLPKAHRDLDGIYAYVAGALRAAPTAHHLLDTLEEAIFSLEALPLRGAERRTGAYAYRGYRQLFAGNFTIVYRVDEAAKQVLVVTVRYSKSQF